MSREFSLRTTPEPLEKTYIRRSTLWLLGLMAGGCLVLVKLVPLWYGLFPPSPKILLLIGALIMAAAIPFHAVAGCRRMKKYAWRRILYIPAILLNFIGVSLFEAAYYTRIEVDPPVSELIAGAVIPIGLCALICLFVVLLSDYLSVLVLIFGGLTLGGIVTCIVFWVKAGLSAASVLWSFALFNLLGVLMVAVALIYAAGEVSDLYGEGASPAPDTENDAAWGWMRFLSFSSFGLFLIVGAVILLILICAGGDCDCDCGCDSCDCGGGGESKGRKRRKIP